MPLAAGIEADGVSPVLSSVNDEEELPPVRERAEVVEVPLSLLRRQKRRVISAAGGNLAQTGAAGRIDDAAIVGPDDAGASPRAPVFSQVSDLVGIAAVHSHGPEPRAETETDPLPVR